MMRAGKPLGMLNDEVECINVMSSPKESITDEQFHQLCREAHGVKMIDGVPLVGRSPTVGTIPTKEWSNMVAEACKSNYVASVKRLIS